MAAMRLDKFLAVCTGGTRSEVKKILKKGAVSVNGALEKRPEVKVTPGQDTVCLEGKKLEYQPFVCLMLHKPAGCVTATEDRCQRTVMDYIRHERRQELFPVGRLDIDTEGLLFLMNDGDLAHRMLSPKRHVEKTYFVRVEGTVTSEDGEAFAEGVDIGEKADTLPARLNILKSGPVSEAELTICEGKFHQVKRMFEARGKRVIYLKRISMAGISLDPALAPGEYREITEEEKERLFRVHGADAAEERQPAE